MRVISGSAGGIRLKVPKRVTRPSTDRLREALFSILGGKVGGGRVLDLFAGSGALGIEAMSRGASEVVFVEDQGGACGVIRENLAAVRLAGRVVKADVFAALRREAGVFDLILADPPYAGAGRPDLAARLLGSAELPDRIAAGGMLVLEVEAERDAPEDDRFVLRDRRVYGSSAILFYEVHPSP
jgi:16S rRNA (guanine966-N2)-methyltransferase